MAGGLTTAIRTLTILPLPGRDAPKAASLPWFPLVGFLLGSILYGVSLTGAVLPWAAWPEGAALLVVILGVVLTRGLHLDGLADWADAAGSLSGRDRMLEIMKDPRVGAFGVLALVTVILAKWIAVARLVASGTAVWIVAACVVSRAMQVELAAVHPYARDLGGTAGAYVRDARVCHRLGSWTLALPLLVAACGPAGAGAAVAGWLLGRAFGFSCRRRFGGVTGDLLGAASEIVETAVLFGAAAGGGGLAAVTGWGWLF